MAEIRHLENRYDVIFFCRVWSDLDKISQTGAEWHVDCGATVEIENSKPDVEFQYGRRLGEFNGMSSQCHIAGCKNSIRHIENRFSPYLIYFLFVFFKNSVWAAAFVTSPIQLFYLYFSFTTSSAAVTAVKARYVFYFWRIRTCANVFYFSLRKQE